MGVQFVSKRFGVIEILIMTTVQGVKSNAFI